MIAQTRRSTSDAKCNANDSLGKRNTMGNAVTAGKRKRKIVGLVLLLVAFAVVLFIIASLILGYITGSSWLSAFFSPRIQELTVDELAFDIGRSRMFANIDGAVAAVGTLGVQVLDAAGNETLREPFRMTQPAIAGSGSMCIAYDTGGTALRVFNGTQIISSIETDSAIVSASINQNGWFCVVTQGGGGLKGVVAVHDNTGAGVYRVTLATGFALSAQLSPDNKDLAILTLPDTGSRIMLYHGIDISEDDPDQQFNFFDRLIIDIFYLSNGDVIAISTDSLFLLEKAGDRHTLMDFPDKRLGGYEFNDDYIALHLYDFGIGYQGRLVTLLADGTVLGELVLDREIMSMSSLDKTLIILKTDGIVFYNENLEAFSESAESISAAGANRVLAVREDAALATSDNSAVVVKRGEGQ